MVASAAPAADDLLITEFMAANSGPVMDEDGDTPDWVEIHNAGPNTVNLDGWFLTDKAANLTQWAFPATNLAPNGYLLVFASGKNRRVPGAPLHTDFQLRSEGEYLALVRPDGTNIATAFGATFPAQVAGISFGIPVQQTFTTLLASGAMARVKVPLDGALGLNWAAKSFDDSSWTNQRTGVGYEAEVPGSFVPVTLANSVSEFSGTQGQSNWFYGYWDKTHDADGVYAATEFTPFPNEGGPYSVTNSWEGTYWSWNRGNPPLVVLNSLGGKPAGAFGGPPPLLTAWAVRRYVSEYDGGLTITGLTSHSSAWINIVASGVASSSVLHLFMDAASQGTIDDIKLVAGSAPEVGANLIVNGDFESGALTPWQASGTMLGSTVSNLASHSGTRGLRVVSTGIGSQQNNSIKQTISPSLVNGQTYTLSYWFLPAAPTGSLKVQTAGLWLNTTPTAYYCGDGTVARVLVDGEPAFQRTVYLSSSNYSINVSARAGSKVDFVLDAGSFEADSCDASTFTANIQTGPTPPEVVADSVADWSLNGVQGENNWFYGYYDQSADAVAGYQTGDFVAFPRNSGPHSTNNFWDGAAWDWWNGDPLFDEIGQRIMQPNGSEQGSRHWVVRRWVSTVSGSITVDWTLAKLSAEGAGVTARVLHKGVQKDIVTFPGVVTAATNRSVVITNVQIGEAIDFAIDPLGAGGDLTGLGDRSLLSAVLRGSPNLLAGIGSNTEAAMRNVNASAYLRIPFTVTNPAAIQFLTLRMKYDDGFLAYLNGQLVASANAPLVPAWNSAATASHSDAAASQYEEFNITSARGALMAGTNILAIHGLNTSAGDLDFLILPELISTQVALERGAQRYFTPPTPGAANGLGTTNVGPLILDVSHLPVVPKDNEVIQVTARALPTFDTISSVRLIYRVLYSNEVNIAMFDDGAHGDGVAGDGLYGTVIPASASSPGQMVRYYVAATDTRGSLSRFPAYDDPQNSEQYLGTVVFNPGLSNPLPVLQMFVQNPVLATNSVGTRCSIFYDGEFYDNVAVSLHGQTTASVFDKRSMDIDMNSSHQFRWNPGQRRAHDFNLITTAADKAHMRHVMSYEVFAEAGVPGHFAFPVRLEMNNAFWGVMHLIENGDDDWLRRLGLDPEGALYKMYLPFSTAYGGVAEKKTRKNENNADLQALLEGCYLGGAARQAFLYDNVDVPEVINFLATIQVAQNEDCCDYKNYYFYRDSNGSGEWQMMPWDLDLTLGRSFTPWVFKNQMWTGGYYDTNIFWINDYYTQARSGFKFIGQDNVLAMALWNTPEIFNMFLRRWGTVQETFLQPSNTHPLRLKFERRVDELTAQLARDAALDLAKWGTFPPTQSLEVAAGVMKTEYFARRRGWIFNTLLYNNGGPYLGPQSPSVSLRFTGVEFNPASGNQKEEYIRINNPNNLPVDVSGWKITGAIDFTFKPGVVIPGAGNLYVSPDVKAFRARATSPRGGEGFFVQGNYQGQLSARGESLQLVDTTGRLVASTNFFGYPSPSQESLRVTEIMYHPPSSPPGLPVDADEFEFIEVRNIGLGPVSLAGVRFVAGVDFDFTGSPVTTLAVGASAVVVRNLAAFTSRYSNVVNVAGQYSGSLDNGGETLRLEDASGEKILEFRYEPAWYPITDGAGFSLAIVNDAALWDTWGLKSSWRPNGIESGTPGQTNPPLPAAASLLITEALTHTDLPAVDWIEVYNPAASAVNLNGWYLSDDLTAPKKHRISGRPALAAGGYAVFTEADFNATPGAPGSFSLSSMGDEVYLFSGDAGGNLTGYQHGFSFGAAENGVSFGRHLNSTGSEQFVAQTSLTPGGVNSGPRVGPVVLAEIHYHPPNLPDGGDNSLDEFIELRNLTATNVALFDAALPWNTWQLRGVVDFDFSTNVVMAAAASLLVANFDPADSLQLAAFRAKHGVSPGVPVLGPYSGKLDNSSGSLKLSKPDAPSGITVPYILVDQVDYSQSAPWPIAADGRGASLQRLALTQFGNEPTNWTAAATTAGQLFGGGVPPVILSQPASQIAIASGSPTFTTLASGTGPLRYQWRFNGTNLPGATNASLVLSNVLEQHAGAYFVAVFNSAGSVASSNALLTVSYGAYFTRQPTNLTVAAGASATFSTLAMSTGALTYQWRLHGTNLPGATSASLTVNNVQPAQAGVYQVIATDGVGSLPSAPALLTVLGAPVILAQPQAATATNGGVLTLNVVATGTAPLSYQWRRNGVNLAGQTGASLFNSYVQPPDAGDYTVVLTNSAGSRTSLVATVTVLVPPVITAQPASLIVTNGGAATFSVTATGTAPLAYQWRFSGTNLPGATASQLSLSNAALANAGSYAVTVSNSLGSVTSAVATLTVLLAPAITAQPQNVTLTNGSMANFVVAATGTAPLAYQWRFADTNLPGATNASRSIPNAQPAQAGAYSVVVSNTAGSITSAVATLTVLVRPAIDAPPQSLTVTNGSSAAFSVSAAGSAPLGYQWRLNGNILSGATSPMFSIPNAQPSHAGGYSVVVNNGIGSATSAVAILTVLVPPTIATPPLSVTRTNGATASFSVVAAGTTPFTYQWLFNAGNLPGATGVSLSLSNVQPADAGGYSVVVNNSAGTVTSAVATLTILVPPSITFPPQGVTLTNGSTANFSVAATGTTPFAYRWLFNGGEVSGATNNALSLSNAQPADAGGYSVVVNNSAGTVTSAVATLTVLVPPAIVTPPASQSVHLGSNANFGVIVSGTFPIGFQWRFGSAGLEVTNIFLATNSTLTVSNVMPGQAGDYRVTVSNLVGSVTSIVATLVLLDGDADGDGMSDLWEIAHDLNPFGDDAAEDADGDRMTNWQEFVAGTDPRDAGSYLKIDQITGMPGAHLLVFLAVSNRTYAIQYRDVPAAGVWQVLTNISARATNRLETATDVDPAPTNRIYRLLTPAQP